MAWLLISSASLQAAGLAAIRGRIDAAVNANDPAALLRLESELAPRQDGAGRYYLAYVQSRIGVLAGDNKKQAKTYLNRCIDTLKAVLAVDPDNVEALALQASCYGASTAYYMLRAATRGMAADRLLKRAMELAPDHPRVLLQDGISLYARPAAFGGDKALALRRLQAAAAAFRDWQPPSDDAPDWGEAETWLYIGRIQAAQGDTEAARSAFKQALSLQPGYAAARQELASLR